MKDFGCIVLIFIAVLVVIFGSVFWIVNIASLPSQVAQIEQLRKDSAHIDPAQAEDVIGQVTSWNQYIRSQQINNQQWWAGWCIPDEWDQVELIEVPQ